MARKMDKMDKGTKADFGRLLSMLSLGGNTLKTREALSNHLNSHAGRILLDSLREDKRKWGRIDRLAERLDIALPELAQAAVAA